MKKDIFELHEHKEIVNGKIIGEVIDYAWLVSLMIVLIYSCTIHYFISLTLIFD